METPEPTSKYYIACKNVFLEYLNNFSLNLDDKNSTEEMINLYNKEFLVILFKPTNESKKLVFYVDCESKRVFDHTPTLDEAGVLKPKIEVSLQKIMEQSSDGKKIPIIIHLDKPLREIMDRENYIIEIISVNDKNNSVIALATIEQIDQLAGASWVVSISYDAVVSTSQRPVMFIQMLILVSLVMFGVVLIYVLLLKKRGV